MYVLKKKYFMVATLAFVEFIQFKGWLNKLIEILFTYCCIIRLANFQNIN